MERFEEAYNRTIELVSDGYGIREALNEIGYSSWSFYKKMSTQQKLELNLIKTSKAKYNWGLPY